MRVEGGASAGYRVISIDAEMRFGGPDDAAKHVLGAWLADDRAKALQATSETVVEELWSQVRRVAVYDRRGGEVRVDAGVEPVTGEPLVYHVHSVDRG